MSRFVGKTAFPSQPLPPALEEWERAIIEPVLGLLFDAPKATLAQPKEMRDDEDAR